MNHLGGATMDHPDSLQGKSKRKLEITSIDLDVNKKTGAQENTPEDEDGILIEDGVIYDETDWHENPTNDKSDGEDDHQNVIGKGVQAGQRTALFLWKSLNNLTKGYFVTVVVLLGYFAYFTYAMINERLDGEGSMRLLVGTIIGVVVKTRFAWMKAIKTMFGCLAGSDPKAKKLRLVTRWLLYLCLAALMVWVLVDQGMKDIRNLLPVPGIIVMLFVCLMFSTAPSQIDWHTIYWSLGLQFICALFVLEWDFGQDAMQWLQDRFNEYFENTLAPSQFIFGMNYQEHPFIFGTIPMIFFSNATLTLLYYLGAIQLIINSIGSVLEFAMNCSPIEAAGVAAGIFLEGGVALLTMLPYLGRLSRSQFFLLTTSLFSSLGGAYLGMLIQMRINVVDVIPAMLMSAPATFTICKLIVPEVVPKDKVVRVDPKVNEVKEGNSSVIGVVQQGATQMLSVLSSAVAIVYVFYAFLSWINHTLEWFGDRVGIDDLSIELIFSYVLYPVSLCMGVEPEDCRRVATLLGYRIGSSNILAFQELAKMKFNKHKFNAYMQMTNFTGPYRQRRDDIIIGNMTLPLGFMTERSERIATYSLCGFSSIVTVGFHIAMLGTLIPRRKKWLVDWFFIILVAGNLANCMTGAFSGIFYYD